jgi:hypothetical protein
MSASSLAGSRRLAWRVSVVKSSQRSLSLTVSPANPARRSRRPTLAAWARIVRRSVASSETSRAKVVSRLRDFAARLLRDAWRPGQPVRLVGVGVSGLEAARRQLTLWDARPAAEDENARRLRAAVAALQDRYGAHAVRWDAGSGSS